jgi:hypothetical protein
MSSTDRFITIAGDRILADDAGRIPLFVTTPCAAAYAAELQARTGIPTAAYSRTSEEIAEFLVLNGLDVDSVYDFEATTESPEDALVWARELAVRTAAAAA